MGSDQQCQWVAADLWWVSNVTCTMHVGMRKHVNKDTRSQGNHFIVSFGPIFLLGG